MTQRASPKIIGESERRRSFCTTTRYADSRMTHKNVIVSDHGEKKDDNMKKEEFKFNYQETVAKLAKYYNSVKRQILRYQSPTTGLFPGDVANHPKEGNIRDSLYCAASVWALAQAYKRIDDDKGKTHELAQSAVKCMRGILACWIRQADRVEKFKSSQSPKFALHCKFHIVTGDPVTKDEDYEHLQIDSVALYLIFLVQMIQSGLQIIFTTDEVHFIQNLIFYVERAYRTPDYGMWERGSKYNNGSSELHASSIGLTKAALESINGENLFGTRGTYWSVIYIDIDAHNRNRTIFDSLLPRESASKNTDASLLPTIGWPAFAIHEEALVSRTREKITRKLMGKNGLKRFLRDGYHTVLEDQNRKYYKPAEIKTFDGIECEWPMFFCYLLIDCVYRGDQNGVQRWQECISNVVLPSKDGPLLPKYYYVREEDIEEEKANPGSCRRVPSGDKDNPEPFLWGQSLYIISQLLVDGLLNINELDPVRRYLPAAERPRPSTRYSSFQSSPVDLVVQIVLIAESVRLQQMLATYGIQTQTAHQIEPMQIWPPGELVKAYEQLGVNNKLNLTGRPARPFGGLGTAKIYRGCGYTFLCYPLLFEVNDFYLSLDMEYVIDDVKSDLVFLSKCWKLAGRPTFCMLIRESSLRGPGARHLFGLLAQFKRGDCDGVNVRVGRLQEFISSACIEHLDFLEVPSHTENFFNAIKETDMGKQFRSLTDIPKLIEKEEEENWVNYQELSTISSLELIQLMKATSNMYCETQVLQVLLNREGLYYRVEKATVEECLESLSDRAAAHQIWAVVRFCASLLGKLVDSLAPSITAVLVKGKQVTVGVFGRDEEVIDKPITPTRIKSILYTKCFPFDVIQAVLQQELILNIGTFITTNPSLFEGILKIRIGWIIEAMTLENAYLSKNNPTKYQQSVSSMSPSNLRKFLLQVLKKHPPETSYRSVIWDRQLDGALSRVPRHFYERVWSILSRTSGGLKVAGYHLPQQPTLSDMTQYELNFSLLVEQMLSKIIDPAYRQVIVESFVVVDTILHRNKELSFTGTVDMDKVVRDAFEYFQKNQSVLEEEEKQDDMQAFYNTPHSSKHGTTSYIAKAVVLKLLDGDVTGLSETSCSIS